MGSSKSGFYGHKGRPGKRGGSAAFAGLLSGPSSAGTLSYYKPSRNERIPSSALSSSTGTVIVSKDGKDLLLTRAEITHAELAWADGIKGRAFDKFGRFRIYRGKLVVNSGTFIDVGDLKTDRAWDRAIDRTLKRTVPTLIRVGFDPDRILEWQTIGGAKIELPLKDYT